MARNVHSEALHGFERDRDVPAHGAEHRNMRYGILHGAFFHAMIVGFNGYILELGTPEIRPMLFALEGTLLFPLYFMPFLGGWIADTCGYTALVLLGIALVSTALIVATTLCEPRRGDPACGPCADA